MGRVIFVTAFKGGVGKTTVASGLAGSLASLGKRVCIVDADFGMRCMDLVLGMESRAVYDCSDVLAGRCTVEDAILPVDGRENLFFLPAPIRYDGAPLSSEMMTLLFSYMRSAFDFCIVDSSAELSAYYKVFASACDEALIVSLHQSTAVRAAEKTAANLQLLGLSRIKLIVNGYRADKAENGELPTLLEIIRRSSVPLIGAIPKSERLPVRQEHGILPLAGKSRERPLPYEMAFLNIATRVCNGFVPLMTDVRKPKRLKKALANAKGLIR